MNIGELIFERRQGESEQQHEARCAENKAIISEALANPKGLRLLEMLKRHKDPMAPRFYQGRRPEDAAFDDGEKSVIGFLITNAQP